ncbi:MAG: tetratricopeptide repeat protein [Candidatus Thorarchaeota archaeon]|jgi:tetratricopeptide (TPR) repeat protein
MYEHYHSSDDVFVDREEYIEWMVEALKRCKKKAVIMHLQGIGGIGKSSLLDYWTNTIDLTIRLDCEQHSEFYDRLNALAKGAVFLGIRLERFDILWQIRQRFVEGVEPVKDDGREWAKEIVMAIPFIGSLASIGSAINAIGKKVTPKLKGKYGKIGKWLQDCLGKNHVEQLLEILWKKPRNAEFLFLDALLEDINTRKDSDRVILFLMDHFEYVDSEKTRWRYNEKQIAENELWRVFLCSLSNCVGVMASRRAFNGKSQSVIEEYNLTELDRESCIELLELRNITDPEIQDKAVSVCGGNPFVLSTLCDLTEEGSILLEDVENLGAETLDEVRLKTWRRLFRDAQNLLRLVEKAGLVPYFDRRIMSIIAPELRTDDWERLTRLSFVRSRTNGTWVLHDLAQDLILTELGQRLHNTADQVALALEEISTQESDYTLLGLAMSVRAQSSESDALARITQIATDLMWAGAQSDVIEFLNAIKLDSLAGQASILIRRGWILLQLNRLADSEFEFNDAFELTQHSSDDDAHELLYWSAEALNGLGRLYSVLDRYSEAEDNLRTAIGYVSKIPSDTPGYYYSHEAMIRTNLGHLLCELKRFREAETVYQESLQIHEKVMQMSGSDSSFEKRQGLRDYQRVLTGLGYVALQQGKAKEAEELTRKSLEAAEESHRNIILDLQNLRNLGAILRMTGDAPESTSVFQETIKICKEVGAEATQNLLFLIPLLDSLSNLGSLFTQIGRLSDAETMFQEALDIVEEITENSPGLGIDLSAWISSNYAITLRKLGRYSEALNAHTVSLAHVREMAKNFPIRYHNRLVRSLSNFGVALKHAGKVSESVDAYSEALEISKNTGTGFPEVVFSNSLSGIILNNLGIIQGQEGKPEDAKRSYEVAIEIWQRLVDKSPELFSRQYATTLNNLGILLEKKGELKEAEEIFVETKRVIGFDSTDVSKETVRTEEEIEEVNPVTYLPT